MKYRLYANGEIEIIEEPNNEAKVQDTALHVLVQEKIRLNKLNKKQPQDAITNLFNRKK